MTLQVFLDHQPAHGVSDEHGRRGELRYSVLHVFDIITYTMPDPTWRPIVAAKLHSPDIVAALGQMFDETVPTPRTVPGTMDKQDGGHCLIPPGLRRWWLLGWRFYELATRQGDKHADLLAIPAVLVAEELD